jgi:HEAT repeat protein
VLQFFHCNGYSVGIEHNKNVVQVLVRDMSASDEIAEEARRLASERTFTANRFLAVLEQGYYSDVDPTIVPTAERDLLLPALRAMVGQRNGTVRLNAAQALVEFGDDLGWEELIECLQSDDSALRSGALDRLSRLGIRDRVRSPNSPIDADALLIALEPSLVDSSRWARERAVTLIGYLGTPRAFDRLVALLGDARPDVRTHAACVLGDAGYDRGALAVIDEMLQAPEHPKRYLLIRALEHLCKSADADVTTRAASVAIGYIRSNLAKHGHSALEASIVANDIWHCLDGITAACSPQEREVLHEALRQVLREVLASKVEWWIRGVALKQLAQLEGQAGITRLIDAVSDPELRKDALEGLASLAAGSDDPAVLEALGREIGRGDATHISALVKAFLAVGGKAKNLAQGIVDRLDPEIAMTVRWLLNDIGPREAAAKLQPACGDVPASDEMLQNLDAKWRTGPDATHVVWSLLNGWKCFVVVFYKGHGPHIDHDEAVRKLAEISGERFAIDEVVQTTESSGDFRVLLVHQGVGYSFPVQNYGRWCNIDAVLKGLNGILDRIGLAERFIEFETENRDFGVLTFANAEIFMPVARELGIRLGRVHTS